MTSHTRANGTLFSSPLFSVRKMLTVCHVPCASYVSCGLSRLPLPHDCPRKLAALIEFCWDANPDVHAPPPLTPTRHTRTEEPHHTLSVPHTPHAQVRPSFVEIVQTIEEMDEEVWTRHQDG